MTMVKRPEVLHGTTYKIKTPQSDNAFYITINDVEEQGSVRPFEIFIHGKDIEHYQWVMAVTRLVSAVWRNGGNTAFLVQELKSIYDPKGGYFRKSEYIPSLVADIGRVIETHLKKLGIIEDHIDSDTAQWLETKRQSTAEIEIQDGTIGDEDSSDTPSFPPHATLCTSCNHKSIVVLDGCQTCLNCGSSKCG